MASLAIINGLLEEIKKESFLQSHSIVRYDQFLRHLHTFFRGVAEIPNDPADEAARLVDWIRDCLYVDYLEDPDKDKTVQLLMPDSVVEDIQLRFENPFINVM